MKTPDGEARLQSYLGTIESKIAQEAMDRKAGLAEMKALVNQNMEYNKAARDKLEKVLREKMELNAQAARDSLNAAMQEASAALAHEKSLRENQGKTAGKDREAIREEVAKVRADAEAGLQQAVDAWTKSQAALASETNAKITQLNEHTAANAALIKADAAKAQAGIDGLMTHFTQQMAAAKVDSEEGIKALGAKVAAADQATRQWVQSKVGAIVALEASKFQTKRKKMAEERHEMDLQMMHAAARLQACLNAVHALQDPTFAASVTGLPDATAKAQRLAAAAVTEFKITVAALGAIVRQQTAELSLAKGQVQGVLPHKDAILSEVQRVSTAELKRLISIADKRYTSLKQEDPELHKLMQGNEAATPAQLTTLGNEFHESVETIRENTHQASRPQVAESAQDAYLLYGVLAEVVRTEQGGGELPEGLKSEKDQAADKFRKALTSLTKSVAASTRRMATAVAQEAGLTNQNAINSQEGRELLKIQNMANRAEIECALADAIRGGQRRGLKVLKGTMSSETEAAVNAVHMKVCAAMEAMSRSVYLEVISVSLKSEAERAVAMQGQLAAMHHAVDVADTNLVAALVTAIHSNATQSRADLVTPTVGALQRAVLVLKEASKQPITSSNTRATASSATRQGLVQEVRNDMANRAANAFAAAKKEGTSAQLSAARLAAVEATVEAAVQEGDKRYTREYEHMAKAQSRAEEAFFKASGALGDAELLSIALKETEGADPTTLAEANTAVLGARKSFTGSAIALMGAVRVLETRVLGDAGVVSGEGGSHAQNKIDINRRITIIVGRIVNLAVQQLLASTPGSPPALTPDRRATAGKLVAALAVQIKQGLDKLQTDAEAERLSQAKDLTAAARTMYEELANAQHGQDQVAQMENQRNVEDAKDRLQLTLNMLVNVIFGASGEQKAALRELSGIPAVQLDDTDRTCLQQHTSAQHNDLRAAVAGAIMLGEAQGKRKDDLSLPRLTQHHQERQELLSAMLEQAADAFFSKVVKVRSSQARNYLSVKAYISAAGDQLQTAIARTDASLSSLADFLMVVRAKLKAPPESATSIMGASGIHPPFSGAPVNNTKPDAGSEALTNEYTAVVADVRTRWRHGIGKYVLRKLEAAMQDDGMLMTTRDVQGTKISINANAIGLTGQMKELQQLAVSSARFTMHVQKDLGRIQDQVTSLPISDDDAPQVFADPPQWQGNMQAEATFSH